MTNCPICSEPVTLSQDGHVESINCPRCGLYKVNVFDKSVIETRTVYLQENQRKLANVSGWIREHQNELITAERLRQLEELSTPSYGERKRKLLLFLQKHSKTLGQSMNLDNITMKALVGSTWCIDSEVGFLLDSLAADALLEKRPGSYWRLTANGYDYLAQLDVNPTSQTGFCAMWFDDSVKSIWTEAIFPAMSDAGYEPKRIDDHHHNNRIDDEIIALIRRSKFVVADFTGQRGGVYFEAGFALGMNLPVIWTVKKSELSSVHFDNRQYNFVTWEEGNLPEFKLNLQYRIEATLGRGTWKPE